MMKVFEVTLKRLNSVLNCWLVHAKLQWMISLATQAFTDLVVNGNHIVWLGMI